MLLLIAGCTGQIETSGRGGADGDAGDPGLRLVDGGGPSGSPGDAGGPGTDDAGRAERDAGVAPSDGGAPGDADAGPPGAGDAGGPGGRPGDGVRWIDWPEQHTASGSGWGAVLTDIVRHLPRSYGDTYYDSDRITYGHETTHGINSHVRNYLNDTGERANGFYCLQDRAVVVVEPSIRKSRVAPYVPSGLRGSRFDLYITGSTSWDDTPLYVFDEWIAYTNGGEVGVDRVDRGLWAEGWRDGVAGQLEFTVYALALGMAVEEHDPAYFRSNTQFRELLAWNARRAMEVFRRGRTMTEFQWDRQDAYYETLRTDPEAEAIRQFVRRTYGDAFARELLEL